MIVSAYIFDIGIVVGRDFRFKILNGDPSLNVLNGEDRPSCYQSTSYGRSSKPNPRRQSLLLQPC